MKRIEDPRDDSNRYRQNQWVLHRWIDDAAAFNRFSVKWSSEGSYHLMQDSPFPEERRLLEV